MNSNSLKFAFSAFVAAAALTSSAVVVRKLPPLTVVENETISFDSLNATAVRSANTAICVGAIRESGEAVVSGARLGEAAINYVDARGVFATRSVTVVPGYWDMLRKMFSEDPEITIEIVGDKVVIAGSTANAETIRRVEQAKALDTSRLVTQVSYSPAQIGELVTDFLNRAEIKNVSVKVVGREVCLAGGMYDQQSIEQVKTRVTNFLKDFPGVTVNTDQLRVLKQKIAISIEFLQYDTTVARNLGVQWPSAITGTASFDYGWDNSREHTGNSTTKGGHTWGDSNTYNSNNDGTTTTISTVRDVTDALTGERSRENSVNRRNNWSMSSKVGISDVKLTVNMLKQNGSAKSLSSTTLTTQSGVPAEFQNGGTIHKQTSDLYKSDLKEIEYGYIVKATPQIIDDGAINLDFDIDVKTYQAPNDMGDYQIPRYQTKSKYLVRPGETIVLSGYKSLIESTSKSGTPFLSHIPWIGPWLFGNRTKNSDENEVVLIVTVDWQVEDTEGAKRKIEEMRGRSVEVKMP